MSAEDDFDPSTPGEAGTLLVHQHNPDDTVLCIDDPPGESHPCLPPASPDITCTDLQSSRESHPFLLPASPHLTCSDLQSSRESHPFLLPASPDITCSDLQSSRESHPFLPPASPEITCSDLQSSRESHPFLLPASPDITCSDLQSSRESHPFLLPASPYITCSDLQSFSFLTLPSVTSDDLKYANQTIACGQQICDLSSSNDSGVCESEELSSVVSMVAEEYTQTNSKPCPGCDLNSRRHSNDNCVCLSEELSSVVSVLSEEYSQTNSKRFPGCDLNSRRRRSNDNSVLQTEEIPYAVSVIPEECPDYQQNSEKSVGQGEQLSTAVSVVSEDCSQTNSEERLGSRVEFLVGPDRRRMTGTDTELSAISPVFEKMLSQPWKRESEIWLQDVDPDALGVILKCAAAQGEAALQLTESSVWDVLRTADQFHAVPVVRRCFRFLLRAHRCRHRSRHICSTLETAHRLHYADIRQDCLEVAKRLAGQILKSKSGLNELCRDCMLTLVKADDLRVGNEILVHDAVVTWARYACAEKGLVKPGAEDIREMAGELVHHVRYLTLPPFTLKNLRKTHPACCLLTEKEIHMLLNRELNSFSPKVMEERGLKCDKDANKAGYIQCPSGESIQECIVGIVIIALLLLFVSAICYYPVNYLVNIFDESHGDHVP